MTCSADQAEIRDTGKSTTRSKYLLVIYTCDGSVYTQKLCGKNLRVICVFFSIKLYVYVYGTYKYQDTGAESVKQTHATREQARVSWDFSKILRADDVTPGAGAGI